MIKVYVTEKPKTSAECPFFMNKKCNMTKDKCCLDSKMECEHLVALEFGFEEVEERWT